jgi:hypothetical protein
MFFSVFEGEGGARRVAAGPGGLGKFLEKSAFIVFCVRVGEPHTKPLGRGTCL